MLLQLPSLSRIPGWLGDIIEKLGNVNENLTWHSTMCLDLYFSSGAFVRDFVSLSTRVCSVPNVQNLQLVL